jgi:hypothetical protein
LLAQRGEVAAAQTIGQIVVDGEDALFLPQTARPARRRDRHSEQAPNALALAENGERPAVVAQRAPGDRVADLA